MNADVKSILKHYPEFSGIHPACEAMPAIEGEDLVNLVEDIRKNGLSESLIRTSDNLLLDGRSRLAACYETNTEIRVVTYKGSMDPWDKVYSLNIARRHLTTGAKAMYAADRQRYKNEQEAAEQRKRTGHNQYTSHKEKFPDASKGQSRDKAGAAVGVSGKSVDKAAFVMKHNPEVVDDVKSGRVTLNKAYQETKKSEKSKESLPKDEPFKLNGSDKVEVITSSGRKRKIDKPNNVRFNKTNDAVDWANWTWNPVTGCEHGCEFCYAREIAHSQRMEPYYPFKFEPTFHEYRLAAPGNTPIPDTNDERDGRVFVCSMADLFGKWVPDDWIRRVFDSCSRSPEWEYLFLTKWPARYARMPLLKRAWYGSSVIKQADVKRVESAMMNFECESAVKWISLEPMLEPITFNDISWCDLMVIGSQTQTSQPTGFVPAFAPDFDWIFDVVSQCREFGVPYYLKANLGMDVPGMNLPKQKPRRR